MEIATNTNGIIYGFNVSAIIDVTFYKNKTSSKFVLYKSNYYYYFC